MPPEEPSQGGRRNLVILGLRSHLHHASAIERRDTVADSLGTTEWPDQKSWFDARLIGDPLGNDEWGNCVEAGMLRQLQCWRLHAQGDQWQPTADDAIELYRHLAGAVEPPGPGTDVAAAEQFWAGTGLATSTERYRTAVAVAVAPQDENAVDRAIAALGGVGMCWDIPEYCEGAREWIWPDSPSDRAGGHFTTCVAYNRQVPEGEPGRYTVLSWGQAIGVSAAFVRQYLCSVVAWISPDWIGPDGTSPAGMSTAQSMTMAQFLR